MFGLTQYNSNGALMATTGFMLTPLASALNRVGYAVSRDEEMSSIAPAQPSSEWSEWLTSGYVGDFLGWAGQQLAEVGRDLFPEFSIPERQRRMEISKEELKRLLAESLLEEDEEADIKIREVLRIYLKQGVELTNRDALDPEIWKKELLMLRPFANRMNQNEVERVFIESIEQLDLLLFRKAQEENFSRSYKVSTSHSFSVTQTGFPDTFDVTDLTNSSNPSGFQLTDSYGTGAFYGGQLGTSVSNAGDVNGDGYADTIVGAYNENSGHGAAYVIFGQSNIVPNTFDVKALTSSSNPAGFQLTDSYGTGYFGNSVSGAGDVNGDGYADIIIGNYYESYARGGVAYVIFGQANFPDTFDVKSLTNSSNPKGFKLIDSYGYGSGRFGWSVSSAGDVNKDGYEDIMVGASLENNFQGAVYVIFGQSGVFPNTFDVSNLTSSSNPKGFQLINSYGGWLGVSVSDTGDVNQDGYADMIVGTTSNAAYVIFGQENFPNTFDVQRLTSSSSPAGFQLTSNYTFNLFGSSVSGAGDINGDGYADSIVGAYRENTNYQGAAYIIFGQESFPNTFDMQSLTSSSNPSGFHLTDSYGAGNFGNSVSNAGDINRDNYADIIIGASGENKAHGAAYVILGQPKVFPNTFDVKNLMGSSNPAGFQLTDSYSTQFFGEYFGYSVSGAGDVNKDGYADMIVGAVGENDAQGASYVIFGEATASTPIPTPTPSLTPTPTPASLYPSTFNVNQLNGKQGFTLLGVNAHDTMGWSVSRAGDINADGIDDMVIGAKSTNIDAGTAYIVFGQAKSNMPAVVSVSKLTGKNGFAVVGLPNDRELGYAVSYAGDVNKDGIADVIMGAPYSSVYANGDHAGKAYVLFGSRSIFPAVYNVSSLNGSNGFIVNGEVADDLLGYSVSTASDVNGDGIADVVIGAPQATANGEIQSGKVYVIFGQRGNFPAVVNVTALGQTQPGFTVYGETEFDKAGQSVAAAGDINADGIADFVIGAPEAGVSNNAQTGKAYVILGNHSGFPQTLNVTALNGQNGFSVNGTSSFDNLGAAVNSAGDVNGDGIADLLIGAPHATVGTGAPTTGAAYVIFGHSGAFAASITPNSLDGHNGCTLIGYASGDQTGASVAGIGDFNVDGVDDVLIGAPKASAAGQGRAGKGYLFFGHRGSYPATINLANLDGNTGMTIEGGSTGDEAGFSVSGAGDINADGVSDLLLGAPGLDNNGAGKSHVLLGGISFFSARPLPRMLSDNNNREAKTISQKMN